MHPHEAVEYFAKPHVVLYGKDVQHVEHLAEAMKTFLSQRCRDFVSARRHTPILEVYMSDGTPLTTTTRVSARIDGEVVRRAGKTCKEYLIQRLYLLDGKGECRVLFRDPLPMSDKSAWSHHRAQYEFWPMCRSLNHAALVVSHHVWDMAVKSACERHARQRHAALMLHLGDDTGMPAELMAMLSWFSCVGCFAHHGHNALKWALVEHLGDKDVARNCWVVLASLRNSFELLTKFLPRWLGSKVQFIDYHDDTLPHVWSLLGENEKWIAILSRLQIRWEGGHLRLAAAMADNAKWVDEAMAALLHLFRFRPWSDSRWCGMGPSSKAMLGCLFCGLDDLVLMVTGCPTVSKYYIQGFAKLDNQVRNMFVVTACSSKVSESFVSALLKDDRLPKILLECDAQLQKDIDVIASLPTSILVAFSKLCSLSPAALRNEILKMLLTQAGYLQARLREVRRPPWSLIGGDVSAKLVELRDSPAPRDETAQKIQRLMQMDVPIGQLLEGIALLAECPWTTRQVEQPHAVAKALLQSHSAYGEGTMLARAVVTQGRTLFTTDPDEKQLARLNIRWEKLRRKQPHRITGRHVYCRGLTKSAALYKKHKHDLGQVSVNKLIKNHKKLLDAESKANKRQLDELAVGLQEDRRVEIRARIHVVTQQMKVCRARLKFRHQEGGTSLRDGLCRLGDCEKRMFDESYSSDEWTRQRVEAARTRALAPVGPPSEEDMSILDSMRIATPLLTPEVPSWVPWMAHHRECLRTCIFQCCRGNGMEFYRFAYASQNPVLVCACRLLPDDRIEKAIQPRLFSDFDDTMYEHCFSIVWDFVYSDEHFGRISDMRLLLDTVCGHDGRVYADGAWVNIAQMMEWMPLPAARRASRESGPREKVSEKQEDGLVEPWMRHPALWHFVRDHALAGDTTLPEMHASEKIVDPESDSVSSDDDFDVWSALADRRAEMVSDVNMPQDFFFNLRGGSWTHERHGVAFDSYRAQARSGLPARFCEVHRLGKTATFSIGRFGESACDLLCRLWCDRMSFLYSVWCAASSDARSEFTSEVLATYREPPEAEEVRRRGNAAAVERADQVLRLAPFR